MFEFWFPNGTDRLSPEEWEEIKQRIHEKILKTIEAEGTTKDFDYLMSLPKHNVGFLGLMVN